MCPEKTLPSFATLCTGGDLFLYVVLHPSIPASSNVKHTEKFAMEFPGVRRHADAILAVYVLHTHDAHEHRTVWFSETVFSLSFLLSHF